MKRNIFEPSTREAVISRINKLTADSKGKWGRLTAPQMIRHLNEACKMAFDEVKVPDQSNFFTRTLGKWQEMKRSLLFCILFTYPAQ